MSGQERRTIVSDEAIRRALRAGPEVAAPADFALTVGRAIDGRRQRRRAWDVAVFQWPRQLGLAGQLLAIALLLLALLLGVILAGSLRERPLGGGPLFIARADQLSVIDPQTGTSTPVLDDRRGIFGVTRSTDGQLVSYWTGTAEGPGTTLELVRADGTGRRRLVTNVTPAPVGRGSIDVFSADGRYLAAAVTAGGAHRILVVDIASGEGWLIGPDEGAGNPLWSPDGEWLAFTRERPGRPSTLAIMRPDGSGLRDIETGLTTEISGPTNWSSDGRWIYFDAGTSTHHVYRVGVESGLVETLTEGGAAAAPALSPDDSLVAYLVLPPPGTEETDSVWVMKADGSDPRLLAQGANVRGWSADGRYVLVATWSGDGSVRLEAITPDATERLVLLTLDACPEPCLQSLSWGWPRP